MDKYVITEQLDGDLVIQGKPESLGVDYIMIDLADSTDSEAMSMVLDVLDGVGQSSVMLIGEGDVNEKHALDIRNNVHWERQVYSAVFTTCKIVKHVWSSKDLVLDELVVEWKKFGKAVLLSTSPLPQELPGSRKPSRKGKYSKSQSKKQNEPQQPRPKRLNHTKKSATDADRGEDLLSKSLPSSNGFEVHEAGSSLGSKGPKTPNSNNALKGRRHLKSDNFSDYFYSETSSPHHPNKDKDFSRRNNSGQDITNRNDRKHVFFENRETDNANGRHNVQNSSNKGNRGQNNLDNSYKSNNDVIYENKYRNNIHSRGRGRGKDHINFGNRDCVNSNPRNREGYDVKPDNSSNGLGLGEYNRKQGKRGRGNLNTPRNYSECPSQALLLSSAADAEGTTDSSADSTHKLGNLSTVSSP